MIQPPGEHREQQATQNFIEDKMTGRVDILWRIFEKIAKKLKMKSQEWKNVIFGYFICKLSKNLIFWFLLLQFQLFGSFLKNAQDYIDPSGNFVIYEIFCSSNF